MKAQIKTKKELLAESKKEQQLAKLFNRCLDLMDAAYRKHHQAKYAH